MTKRLISSLKMKHILYTTSCYILLYMNEIIKLFNTNVKDKKIEIIGKKHCGSEGHWLETQMGIKHNSKNLPDLFGYEMKKNSKKITFGDFSASEMKQINGMKTKILCREMNL